MNQLPKTNRIFVRAHEFRLSGLRVNTGLKTLVALICFFITFQGVAQGPNPQTGMRVIGTIKLSGACEKDTLKMENLTKDSAKTVKYYIHSYNYFNDPFYPNYKDTFYTKANGTHIYTFKDSLALATCFRSVNLYFGIIAYDTFGIDYPVLSRITVFLRPRAIFNTDSVICAGDQLSFTNSSCKDSTKFKWIFSDTIISARVPGSKNFKKPGKQTIKLVANTSTPCAQTDTMVKQVNVLPIPEPGFKIVSTTFATFTDSVICLGDTLFLINTSKKKDSIQYRFTPAGYIGLAGNSKSFQDTVKIVMLQKGIVTIEQEAFNKACSRLSPKRKLLVIQNPFVTIKPLPKCSDSLWMDLNQYVDTSIGVPKNVQWKINGNGLNLTINTLFPGVLKNLKYGKYFVKVISMGGCRTLTSADSFFVAPQIQSPNPIGICFGLDSVVKLNQLFKLPKGFIINWTGPVSNDSLFKSKGKAAGTYNMVLTDRNSNCYNPQVKIDIIGSGLSKVPDQHLCFRNKPVLALDSLVTASYTGKGVINDTFYSTQYGPGYFPVQYISTVKTCIFKDSLNIIVHDTFTPQFSFRSPGCQDSAIVFQKNTPENVVLWSFGDGVTSTLNNPIHRYQTPGKYRIEFIARTYCPDTLSKPIVIYPSPEAELQIQTDTFACDSVIVYAGFKNKGYGETYTIVYGKQILKGDSVRFAIAKSFQPQQVIVYGSANSQCGSKTSGINVRIPQRNYAAIEILGLNPGCHGDSLKLVNLTYGPLDSFRVDYGNGLFSKNVILKLPYYNNTSTLKTYTIVLKVYSKYCGLLQDTAYYKVIPNVIRAAGEQNKKKLCSYESLTFINNCTEGTNYNMFFGDGGSSKGNVYHESINYQYKIPGVYIPYIKAVSACGADSALLDTVRVNGAPDVHLYNVRSKMCLGSEIFLKYSPGNLLSPKWFVNDVLVDSLVNPFIFHPQLIGKYRIGVIASNQFCVGLDSFDIDVQSAPDIKITMNSVVCDTAKVVINGNYTVGNLKVNWGDGISDFAKLYHVYRDTGLFVVKIMLTEGLCTLYFEREITVKAPPKFTLLMHPALNNCLNPGDTINMEVKLDSLPYQVDLYNWAGEPICSNCERKILDINYMNCQPKQFIVKVRDKDQCVTEKEINYSCFDAGSNKYKAFIPNAFTPKNGDLLNDLYLPKLAYYDTGMSYSIKIYNRWGELVFQSNDPGFGWDGTYKGNVCPMDVYVYIIEYGCPEHRYNKHRGTLHLLK